MSHEDFHNNELIISMQAGAIAGAIAAAITNPLEAITVGMQTNSQGSIGKIIRGEGIGLITKGLVPRVVYNTCQSLIFFSLIKKIEQAFNVKLEDD